MGIGLDLRSATGAIILKFHSHHKGLDIRVGNNRQEWILLHGILEAGYCLQHSIQALYVEVGIDVVVTVDTIFYVVDIANAALRLAEDEPCCIGTRFLVGHIVVTTYQKHIVVDDKRVGLIT